MNWRDEWLVNTPTGYDIQNAEYGMVKKAGHNVWMYI